MAIDTSKLKAFAPEVRRRLIEAVGRKLDYVLTADTADLRAASAQVNKLRQQSQEGRTALVEQVAYTWFNRLAALRFLDARSWHPFHTKVLMPATPDETQPEILKHTRVGTIPDELKPFVNVARLNDILNGRLPSPDPQGEVYRNLVLGACRFYHDLMPFLFEKLDDETEFLLPDDVLTEHSIAQGFRIEINDDACAEVEILGWLYQFYISDKKDQIMARKSAVPTEDIPAVTQLFTPHWIVRYLVENSLGRLWLLNRPDSKLRQHMPYYIEGETDTNFLRIGKPEDIRVLDPAVGSGHMLTYAFDLLCHIYEEEGHATDDIPALILQYNLHGLDICPRAAQLAELALVFKAREKSRNIFQKPIQPNICTLHKIVFKESELNEYMNFIGRDLFTANLETLLHQFEEAENIGSLIQPAVTDVQRMIKLLESKDVESNLFIAPTHEKVLKLLKQSDYLIPKYHVVVANPPYMGGRWMNDKIREFLLSEYADVKSDLFSAFIIRNLSLALPKGHLGFMSPFVWMFISSYEKLRKHLITKATITSLIQLEYSGFDGAVVPICTFTIENLKRSGYKGGYVRLSDFKGSENQAPRTLEAIKNPQCSWFYRASTEDFGRIPGSPIAYWVSDTFRNLYNDQKVESITISDDRNKTGNNDVFVRQHWEVSRRNVGISKKWFFYAKGGGFRRWYGNLDDVINWSQEAREHYRKDHICRIIPEYLCGKCHNIVNIS